VSVDDPHGWRLDAPASPWIFTNHGLL